jgi:hypothetical protein
MKNLFLPFKAIFSLGWLGLVLLLLAGSILWALDSQESEPFDAAQERMTALSMLENDLPRALNQMKLYEARKIFSLKYDQPEEQDYARLAQESDAEVSAILTEMEEAGHLDSEQPYVPDLLTAITAFNHLRAPHRATFDALVEAYQADDQDRINDLADQFEIENEDLDFAQRDMVIEVEQGRLEAKRDFPEDINESILIATGGLALSLVLALVGFQLIAAAVRPLGTLRNAVTAIAGDQYRPEMLSGRLKARGPAGQRARARGHLSAAVQQRDSGLKAETERLRQALYESRRRRLKIYHPEAAGKEQS